MKKQLLLITLLIGVMFNSYSQSIQIEGIKGRYFSGVHEIHTGESDEVHGYYTSYVLEKAKKGMRTFQFALINKEVTEVIKTNIELHKHSQINNTVFNGNSFLISWDDRKNKKSVFKIIDSNGKIVATKEIEVNKKRKVGTVVYPMSSGEGFYIVRSEFNKNTFGYSIEKVDNHLKQIWKKDHIPAKGRKGIAGLIDTPTRFAVWEEVMPKGNKQKPMIVCYDAKTGNKIFERDGFDGASTILFNRLKFDKSGNLYAGGAYVDGEKYKSVNNNGIYLLKLDQNGKEVIYTKVENRGKIQAALKTTTSGRKGLAIGSKDKVFIEDLIITDDGIVVVSEMFRKNANMTPASIQDVRDLITGKFIARRRYYGNNDKRSKVTFQIMDFMLFKFSNNGKLENLKPIFKEEYNKITVWDYSFMGGQAMARMVRKKGWFDYGFTITDDNGKSHMVTKYNATKNKPIVYTYNLSNNFTKSKIDLKQEARIDLEASKVGHFDVMRNTNNTIAVAYFQKKLKRITINIESLFEVQ